MSLTCVQREEVSDEFDEEDEVAVSMAIPGGRAGGQLQSRSHSGDTKLGDLL
jgi:hypothetical protein